jgi:hypothetical protein
MIQANRARLEQLVEHLLEAETMDGRDVEELLREGRILSDDERAAKKSGQPDAAVADVGTEANEAKPPPPDGDAGGGTEGGTVTVTDGQKPPPLP